MTFNEQNTIEYYLIQQMTGVDLSRPGVMEAPAPYRGGWQYRAARELARNSRDILIESEVRAALLRLNPGIAAQPERADEVLHKLYAILHAVGETGLVRANEEFAAWLCGDKSMPFGDNYEHVAIRLLDFNAPENNSYLLANQVRVEQAESKIPDLVLYINGMPVVVGELKTPTRPAVSWLDGAHELRNIYEESLPQLFVPNILSFASEGKLLYYGAVRAPLEKWAPWRAPGSDATAQGLAHVGSALRDLLQPARLLDILYNFTLYATGKRKERIKIIPRLQQYEGANALVQRVLEGRIKKGLLWHFQGSGKSYLMVFAAQKLRAHPALKSPTVLVLVDRTDLDSQISGTFHAADVSNVVGAESIKELQELLGRDMRKVIISTIHKFRDAPANMNTRGNIIVMVDEAHRTQEGDLGRLMRAALPNAFLFGLTGTPINKNDRNTFWAFGAEEDPGGYMSRYSFQDSIRDGATLPLHFEPRLVDVHVDKEALERQFAEFKESNALSDEESDALSKRAAHMATFLKAPERVAQIAADIAAHYRSKLEAAGFKALVVTPDRYACVQYKAELDKHLPAAASRVLISTAANDSKAFKQQWAMDKGRQEALVEEFNDPRSALKMIIVTAKLLTGFDAPLCQTMYLDKSLKDHSLLQAICRTNRLAPGKNFGCIVDYFGIFDDSARALEFDDMSVEQIISGLSELRDKLPEAMSAALAHFPGVDRTQDGFAGLEAAQQAIATVEQRDAFAGDFRQLARLWEALSPDRALDPYTADYLWLTAVFDSVKPATENIGRLLWLSLGAQTTQIIHDNIHVRGVHALESVALDADVIDEIANNPGPDKAAVLEDFLVERFRKRAGLPVFKSLSERLENLRRRAEQGLIASIDFVKELCTLAKDTLLAEQELAEKQQEHSPKAALTELFLELKTEQTPAVVERIVNDIDGIVRAIRFAGWQNSSEGRREVQQALRRTLLKYQLHKDQALFDRAYAYIEMYY